MGYDKEQIGELCRNFSLLDYVEQDYDIEKKSGGEYAIHCPKHKDKTASLFINPSKNVWNCQSCHRSGGPLQWLMQIEDMGYHQAVQKLQDVTGMKLQGTQTASSLRFFKSLQSITDKENDETMQREILPDDYMDRFELFPDGEPKVWIDEGISPEMIRKYNIRYDRKSNRIVYPVYDNQDNLIGVKGRTLYENYKVLGITKYINYTKIGKTDYFQGMHENRETIKQTGRAIIFEGIKSVMKADAWGYHNCIAAETSMINDEQAKILIQMGVGSVVIAFDNDVEMREINISASKIKHFINVEVIQDKNGLAGVKSSPVDNGIDIWRKLYEQRQRIM